jgi:hypothetical protein
MMHDGLSNTNAHCQQKQMRYKCKLAYAWDENDMPQGKPWVLLLHPSDAINENVYSFRPPSSVLLVVIAMLLFFDRVDIEYRHRLGNVCT